jgi:alkyl sulfatase BDS1-like metallo-beta-lactamase superfamily hydrolase
MKEVSELAERAWNGDLGDHNVHPGRVLVAFEEYAPDLGFMSAFSNVCVLKTGDGLVFFDTSSFFHARQLFEDVRTWSSERVHTAVYTHGHVDHVFGLKAFEEEAKTKGWGKTEVIAHENCAARFDRYILTNGYNGVINQRQFGFPEPSFPRNFRYPDRQITADTTLTVGDHTIELRHDRGETDDHVWAWLPEHKTIYTGDLFIWASPNCGNPQKAQRYPREWAMAFRKMQALGAERLFPGHGPPIIGKERVHQALDESARLLETLVEQTLEMMNAGERLNDIMHTVQVPAELLQRPYLRPVYDDPMFIVRNLWRLYGGWYDGNPAHLKPASDATLAKELAQLAGGAEVLAKRAESLAADGQLAIACDLAEHARQAAPDDAHICGVHAAVYRQRAKQESSLMAQAIYNAAARDSETVT